MRQNRLKIVNNSPVVLAFTLICAAALLLDKLTAGASTGYVFSVYRCSLLDPLAYVRFFGHVFGHASVSHLMGNLMLLLITGPLLEEKYGSRCIIFIILITAPVTGVIHFILFPETALLGASGVVFAFILLASFTDARNGEIPLTFILVAMLYLGQQIYEGVFASDNISQLTHIAGGIVGAVAGFRMRRGRRR